MSKQGTTDNHPPQIHVFERHGLGRAPFYFDGFEDTAAHAGPDGMVRVTIHEGPMAGVDMLTKPGGSCDLCGTYITFFCWVRDADGKRFKVGSTCLEKYLGKREDDPTHVLTKAKRAIAKHRTALRNAAADRRIAAAIELMSQADVETALRAEPHPSSWRAEQGDTRLEWCQWMLTNAGRAGKTKVARFVERAAKNLAAAA
jgi:hypothetical protein